MSTTIKLSGAITILALFTAPGIAACSSSGTGSGPGADASATDTGTGGDAQGGADATGSDSGGSPETGGSEGGGGPDSAAAEGGPTEGGGPVSCSDSGACPGKEVCCKLSTSPAYLTCYSAGCLACCQ
jgi:hypothetical protein